jgi:hypothetical protein
MNNYQIIREEYHNEYGEGKGATFYVKELKPFLFFWKRWVYIKHTTCGWGDCYKEKTSFSTVEKARNFIKNVLCTNLKREQRTTSVVEEGDCISILKR